jgi:signal transduction histidine kinase
MLNTNNKVKRKLSLGTQIIAFSSLFLFALPWLGYRYMDEMKEFLVEGQSNAQLLAARAIATILHNRSDLFGGSTLSSYNLVEENLLYVYPLDHKLVIDGYSSDWDESLSQNKVFNAKSYIHEKFTDSKSVVSFNLLMAEYDKYLYGFLSVNDSNVVYRHPGYARLDSSDQVRIELIDNNGNSRRYSLLTEAPGNISVYEMHENWIKPHTGVAEYGLTAIWKDTSNGYDVEFRLPKKWLNDNQDFMISVADVNNKKQRKTETIVASLPPNGSETLNKLIIRSPELDKIINGLGYADTNICIVDQFSRVRVVLGKNASQSKLCSLTDKVSPDFVSKTLMGDSNVQRVDTQDGETLVIASHPVYQDKNIMGAVLIEKNSTDILANQWTALTNIILATVIVFTIAVVGLVLFSSLLAFRIRKLQREVSTAIDSDGRLINEVIVTSKNAGDEIGELSRGFSTLLSKLKNYTAFLESVPGTLRHEILNPLNTISMSLQKMSNENQSDKKLINSANQALRQLELIVFSLTEAAHIEDALSKDEKAVFDLAMLLSEYVSNIKTKHINNAFSYTGPDSGIYILANDLRIIQLLDKIKDNAIDFSAKDTEIKFVLNTNQLNQVVISICNKGTLIPENIISNLCNNILSHRQAASRTPHLGIGLYVASHIAKYNKGSLKIFNNNNKDGVCVMLLFPLASN